MSQQENPRDHEFPLRPTPSLIIYSSVSAVSAELFIPEVEGFWRGGATSMSTRTRLSFHSRWWIGVAMIERDQLFIIRGTNSFRRIFGIFVPVRFPFVRIIIRSYCPFVLFKNQLIFDKSDRQRLIFIGIGGMKGKIYMFSYNRKCDV